MFSVIYEDEMLIVVHKMAGIPVQTRKTGQKDMVSLLKNYRARRGEEPYIGLVHRLDQPVEGVMVFAKNPKAAADLSRQAAEGLMEKTYHAVVYLPADTKVRTGEARVLTDYLVKDGKNNRSFVADKETPGAKKAVLTYRFLRQNQNLAEVEVMLGTGRHHQIRVQMSHGGFPLVGDRKYGTKETAGAAEGNSLALCSIGIGFTHPGTLNKLEFKVQPQNPIFSKLSEGG